MEAFVGLRSALGGFGMLGEAIFECYKRLLEALRPKMAPGREVAPTMREEDTKMCPMELLGTSWGRLGASRERLEAFWERLRRVLERLEAV